jgi:hypothetical protein
MPAQPARTPQASAATPAHSNLFRNGAAEAMMPNGSVLAPRRNLPVLAIVFLRRAKDFGFAAAGAEADREVYLDSTHRQWMGTLRRILV